MSAGQALASPAASDRHLQALSGRAAVDLDAAEAAARSLLTAFGADLEAEGYGRRRDGSLTPMPSS